MFGDDLTAYYGKRAREYETVYAKPERQADLARLHQLIAEGVADRDVLEVACGTGFWTAAAATTARSITATDITPEVLAVARAKTYGPAQVRFVLADAFALDTISPAVLGGPFNTGFVAFWWSHVPRERLAASLDVFHRSLSAGARVVCLDNRYVEGSSTPIARTDEAGNTYQHRRLADGSAHEVRKNFLSPAELRAMIQPRATDLTLIELPYYWFVSYTLVRSGDFQSA